MTSPNPATTHSVDAVVNPATMPRAWTMVPAPRNPMPGDDARGHPEEAVAVPPFDPMSPAARLIIMAEPTQTRMLVRKPAGLSRGFPFQADDPAEGDGQDEFEHDVDEFHWSPPFRQCPARPSRNAAAKSRTRAAV